MKCQKCEKSEATVFFATISGKFKATRRRYCRSCMDAEKIKLSVPNPPAIQTQQPTSLIDVVKKELAKKDTGHFKETTPSSVPAKPPPNTVDRLREKMRLAVADANYEEAARIRDEIAAISGRPKSKPGDEKAS